MIINGAWPGSICHGHRYPPLVLSTPAGGERERKKDDWQDTLARAVAITTSTVYPMSRPTTVELVVEVVAVVVVVVVFYRSFSGCVCRSCFCDLTSCCRQYSCRLQSTPSLAARSASSPICSAPSLHIRNASQVIAALFPCPIRVHRSADISCLTGWAFPRCGSM